MKMTVKNKIGSKITQLCIEARRMSSIPKDITLSRNEAKEFIAEYHQLLKNNYTRTVITNQVLFTTKRQEDLTDQFHPSRLISMLEDTMIYDSTISEIVSKWANMQIQVTFTSNEDTFPLLVESKARPTH